MLKKIVIIGPESTGKSTLSEQLARHFQTEWVPEYAREFLLNNGKRYNYADLLTIAQGQIRLEEEFTPKAKNNLLFIDTNMVVMKVWCEFVFNECHAYILEQLKNRRYDLYLLCSPDLPWVHDELREYPDLETREKLFLIYQQFLRSQEVPWTIISGHNDERFQRAVEAVNTLGSIKK